MGRSFSGRRKLLHFAAPRTVAWWTPNDLAMVRALSPGQGALALVPSPSERLTSAFETQPNQCCFPWFMPRSTHCKALELLESLRPWEIDGDGDTRPIGVVEAPGCGPVTCPPRNASSRSADCGRAALEHGCHLGALHCSRVRHSSRTPRTVHGHGPRREPACGRRQGTRVVRKWSRALALCGGCRESGGA
jgi:hypothetical protein